MYSYKQSWTEIIRVNNLHIKQSGIDSTICYNASSAIAYLLYNQEYMIPIIHVTCNFLVINIKVTNITKTNIYY